MKFLVVAVALSAAQAQNFPVQIIGSEGEVPETAFPLGKCMGDCNRHRDCEGTLMCFARGGATTVPGCEGELPMDGTDICWDPNDRVAPGVIANIGRNGNPPQLFPLQQCQGSCSTDEHCAEGLVCYFRSAIQNTVPGCEGEPLPDGADYCVRPEDLPYGVGGGPPAPGSVPAPAPVIPVVDPVDTGTTDATETNVDSVTELPDNFLMITYNAAGPIAALPLQNCQGNCGTDDDCGGDLVCFQRNANEPVPGCVGLALDFFDYCVQPGATVIEADPLAPSPSLPAGVLSMVFSGGIPSESLPLQHCQGDCDDDMDCDEGLSCFLRETEDVPGCTGLAPGLVDYCIKTEDIPKQIEEPTPVTSPTSGATEVVTTGIFSVLAATAFL